MLFTSTATTMTGVCRNVTRTLRTAWTRATSGERREFCPHRAGKPCRLHVRALGRQHEQVGVKRRVHPVEDRAEARRAIPANATTSASDSISAATLRRSPPRRLDEAVGGKRALDRPQPSSSRTKSLREGRATDRANQQRRP